MGSFEQLRQECMQCARCGLCRTRTNLVFGVGNEKAPIVFVGEGPGEKEDLQGVPVVGPAGQLLERARGGADHSKDGSIRGSHRGDKEKVPRRRDQGHSVHGDARAQG